MNPIVLYSPSDYPRNKLFDIHVVTRYYGDVPHDLFLSNGDYGWFPNKGEILRGWSLLVDYFTVVTFNMVDSVTTINFIENNVKKKLKHVLNNFGFLGK